MGKAIIIGIGLALLLNIVLAGLITLGMVGYGWLDDRFSPDMIEQYKATWNNEKLIPPPPEPEEEEEEPQEAAARIAVAELEQEMMSRELQLQLQTLADMKSTVQTAQGQVDKKRQELAQVQELFQQQLNEQQRQAQEEGFLKALANYSAMNPKLVKEDFMHMTDSEVVRYLSAMKADVSTSILEKFKTPEEQMKRQQVMQLLEQQKKLDPYKQVNAK